MRKNIYYLAVCCLVGGVAALSLTGCKTDEEPEWPAVEETTPSVKPDSSDSDTDKPADTADFRAVRLNELNGNKPKFIELYNTSAQTVDISGMKLRKNGDEIVYEAPQGTLLAAGSYLALPSDQADYTLGFTSGFSAKKSVLIELLGPDDTVVDVFVNPSKASGNVWDETDPKYNGDASGEAYGRKPDGIGEWYMIQSTQGTTNNDAATSEKIIW